MGLEGGIEGTNTNCNNRESCLFWLQDYLTDVVKSREPDKTKKDYSKGVNDTCVQHPSAYYSNGRKSSDLLFYLKAALEPKLSTTNANSMLLEVYGLTKNSSVPLLESAKMQCRFLSSTLEATVQTLV